jgi:uncharacterized protein (DUF58 family)
VRWLRGLAEAYRERLTARGRYLLWVAIACALLGVDTRRSQSFVLFAGAASMLVAASAWVGLVGGRSRVRIACVLPPRATARMPLRVRVDVVAERDADVELTMPRASETELPGARAVALRTTPKKTRVRLAPGTSASVFAELQPLGRGRLLVRPPAVRGLDPLGVATSSERVDAPRAVLVHPRRYVMEAPALPGARMHQPGGLPLGSWQRGGCDGAEFVGTREYRRGDPLRQIHWRSFARRGAPVIKEFQEEYFSRIAVVLDTYEPRRARTVADEARFEAAVSVVASLAEAFAHGEAVIDVLAAGKRVHRVSAGDGVGHLDGVLDVLACVEPTHEPPFASLAPFMAAELPRLSCVLAVLLDWDEPRRAFLRALRAGGPPVRVVLVREGTTTVPIGPEEGIALLEHVTPSAVEARLRASEEST